MQRGVQLRSWYSRKAARTSILGLFSLALLAGAAAAEQGQARRADLVVRSVSNPPGSVAPGQAVVATITVGNRGKRRAGRSTARAYLSRDSRKSSNDMRLAGISVPPLKPGKASRRTAGLTIPRAISSTPWFLIVCSDDARRVRETNERNNCRADRKSTRLNSSHWITSRMPSSA